MDEKGNYLGTVYGSTAEIALEKAKKMMPMAASVEERDMPIFRESPDHEKESE